MRAAASALAENARQPVWASLVTVPSRVPSSALDERFASVRCHDMPSRWPRKREPST